MYEIASSLSASEVLHLRVYGAFRDVQDETAELW